MRILFVDPVCNKPYDPHVLATQSLGGTEATVIRIAEALVRIGHVVRVAQHCRKEVFGEEHGAAFVPFGESSDFRPTHVIVLRAPLALYQARKQFPSAKLYLWCHDIFGGAGWDKGFQALVDTNAIPVLVSEWHKNQMYDFMSRVQFKGQIPSRRIYNPVDDALKPDATPVQLNKLVFFSSPHKGLEHTLKVFDKFQNFEELRDFKLYVANPGYLEDYKTEGLRNVVNLGPLPHSKIIEHVRSALCVFHLNTVFPETMGIVFAEANAVGTPFLSSRLGAVPEIADHPAELGDVADTKMVIDRVLMWGRQGRPRVRLSPCFRLSKIVREWVEFLSL